MGQFGIFVRWVNFSSPWASKASTRR